MVERRIDLNTANHELLIELPGIGPTLARRITSYREAVGEIRDVDELEAIAGVRPDLIAAIRDRVSVARRDGAEADVPAPTTLVVVVSGGTQEEFRGHRLIARFTRLEPVEGSRDEGVALPVPSQISADLGESLEVTLTLPNAERMQGDLTLQVAAPDGAVLAIETLPTNALPAKVEIAATPLAYAAVEKNTDPAFQRPTRLRGQVIDKAGKRQIANRQIVIWGAQKDNPEEKDFRALLVVRTDTRGYFSGPYPVGEFTAANGAVLLGDTPISEPIHLDDKQFPESVILVIDLTALALEIDLDDECGESIVQRDPDMVDLARADGAFSVDPGAGRCVDFTKPDRTLEEFRYSYAVRTTEPVIRGLTLDEPRKIDLSRIGALLKNAPALSLATAEREIGTPVLRSAVVDDEAVNQPFLMAMPLAGIDAEPVRVPASQLTGQVSADILHSLARDPDGFSLTSLATAAKLSVHADLLRLIGLHLGRDPGRNRLTCDSPVDWDDDPTIYQSCTIAHGHILNFKQEWVADGYSMGNLLYSLPLAPGQKKQIAIVDWERRESAARTEALDETEALSASLSRDRDINEIVSGVVNESTSGGSESSTGGFAAGLGIGGIVGSFGGLLGIGGGSASADSSAWQNSSRNTSASALNQLRDRTIQSASAARSQRSTVVQSVRQGERVVATTESVANYNHCHAITIQYFEVLRHMLVRQRLTDVQECLFVPLLMSRFNSAKTLRWRNTLRTAVPDRRLRGGFDALDRIARNYSGSDFPAGAYANENITYLEGDLRIRFELARPKDKDDDFEPVNWGWLGHFFPSLSPDEFYRTYLRDQQHKDRVFLEQLGPRIAQRFVQHLQFFAVDSGGGKTPLPIDTTLLSDFVNDRPLSVTLRMSGAMPALTRSSVSHIEISDISKFALLPFFQILPAGSRVIVESGTLRYRTAYSSDTLFRNAWIQNDLNGGDSALIFTPPNRQELRNSRQEDRELSRQLLDHLNENLERYHHALLWRMSPDRRYLLLDGFEAPNSGGRSVASVVDNRLVGIVGNSLIMPVSPGHHLDPTFNQKDPLQPIDLIEHYQPTTPIEPMRLAMPTRGVYAEAVMGACNSCEFKEEERFWRWEESPIPDSPTGILPLSTETRRAEPPDLTARDFPAPIINLQNAPAAPDPTGLAAAFQLLGTPNIFKDITGLEGTQKNAAAALQGAFENAQFFGKSAADLALQGKMGKDIDKAMRTIQTAQARGLLTEQQSQSLTESAIRGMIGGGAEPAKGKLTEQPEVKKLLDTSKDQPGDSKVSLEHNTAGETEKVDVSRTVLSSSAGSTPAVNTTIGRRSTKAQAVTHITGERASTVASPWKIDRTLMLDRLQDIVNQPDKIYQDGLNLCGPAAFLRLWIARDPLAVVRFATELYNTGKSSIGTYEVEPDDDSLIAQDYAALAAANADFTPSADWMIMGSLRDAENFFFDFEGVPGEDVAAATTPGEVADWLSATNLYAVVNDEGNFFFTKGIDHAITLKPSPTRDIALLINAHMLTQMNVTQGQKKSDDFILNAFPNHFVVLTSQIQETSGGDIQLSVWTWGEQISGTIDKDVFEANYYGAVMGEGGAP